MRRSSALTAALLIFAGVAVAGDFDISSGGLPSITGSLGGSVSGSSDTTQNLAVTVNFGEVSPANVHRIVKVVVPIAIRSNQSYQVTASLAGAFDSDPSAVQPSDIGFGVANVRPLGDKAQSCPLSPHLINPIFDNDPSVTVGSDANGRAAYPSSTDQLKAPTVILSGARLTKGSAKKREPTNGYAFDAILAITPQFYSAGTFSATIIFTITEGPKVPCQDGDE
jgi:hypothetical protein